MALTDNVATLIHDLKTPVIAQERVLDLLLKNTFGELNEAQTEIICQIKESCKYLQDIVYSAMDTYISNSKTISINKKIFNIDDVINSVLEETKILADEKNQSFCYKKEPFKINADKFQIKRVITNLIANSIKYSYPNSEIEIVVKNFDKNLLFFVKNTAPNIKNLTNVFEKFESTSNSGLGLYLVKQIISEHKGKVFAHKESENYYTFGFVIPLI